MRSWTEFWEAPHFGGHIEGEAFLSPIGEITDRDVAIRVPLDPTLVAVLLDPDEWQGSIHPYDELDAVSCLQKPGA